mgnify:CR=1 FL=1
MLTPGPDHPITTEPARRRWRVKFAGHVIADTNDALILREGGLPQVIYFPREDVSLEYMSSTPRSTHSPYKGDAAYFTLAMDGQIAENVAWSYEAPFPAMDAIAGRIAFYPDRVDLYEVDDVAVNPQRHRDDDDVRRASIGEVIRHTDAGDGTSQSDHWEANVDQPPLGGEAELR